MRWLTHQPERGGILADCGGIGILITLQDYRTITDVTPQKNQ